MQLSMEPLDWVSEFDNYQVDNVSKLFYFKTKYFAMIFH